MVFGKLLVRHEVGRHRSRSKGEIFKTLIHVWKFREIFVTLRRKKSSEAKDEYKCY